MGHIHFVSVGSEMFSPGVVLSLATSILVSTTGFVLAQDDPYPACYQFFTTWPQASSVNASSGIHSDIDSAQSCQLLCVQTEDCVAFSWHFGSEQFDENTCQLFSEVGEETSSCSDCVSGPKSCTCSQDVACSVDAEYLVHLELEVDQPDLKMNEMEKVKVALEEECQDMC